MSISGSIVAAVLVLTLAPVSAVAAAGGGRTSHAALHRPRHHLIRRTAAAHPGPASRSARGRRVAKATPASKWAWRAAWGSTIDATDNGVPEYWLANQGEVPQDAASPAGATYRLIARPTVGGRALRLRFANTRGDGPLTLSDVTVAVRAPQPPASDPGPEAAGATGVQGPDLGQDPADAAAIEAQTVRGVTFGGRSSVTIAKGESAWSDPVPMHVTALRELAISVYVPDSVMTTSHHNSCVSQYVTPAGAGDHARDASGAAFTTRQEPLPWLDAIAVDTRAAQSVVTIGDSVTDGVQFPYNSDSCMNLYTRYPDYLAARTNGAVGWVNEGLGADSSGGVLARLGHDVLDLPGVTAVSIEIGINDVGSNAAPVIANLEKIYAKLHAAGLRVIGVTLPPSFRFLGIGATEMAARDQVNQFIRTTKDVDSVIDLAKTVGLAQNDDLYQPQDDSGDGLHPSSRGYYDIAQAVDLPSVLGDAR